MPLLYVTEYAGVGFSQIGAEYSAVPLEPPLADYTVSIPGTSPVFQPTTILVRLATDSICSVKIGLSPVATTTNARMAANQTEYRGVPQAGFSVSVVPNT